MTGYNAERERLLKEIGVTQWATTDHDQMVTLRIPLHRMDDLFRALAAASIVRNLQRIQGSEE